MKYGTPELYEVRHTWTVWSMAHLNCMKYGTPELYEVLHTWTQDSLAHIYIISLGQKFPAL